MNQTDLTTFLMLILENSNNRFEAHLKCDRDNSSLVSPLASMAQPGQILLICDPVSLFCCPTSATKFGATGTTFHSFSHGATKTGTWFSIWRHWDNFLALPGEM